MPGFALLLIAAGTVLYLEDVDGISLSTALDVALALEQEMDSAGEGVIVVEREICSDAVECPKRLAERHQVSDVIGLKVFAATSVILVHGQRWRAGSRLESASADLPIERAKWPVHLRVLAKQLPTEAPAPAAAPPPIEPRPPRVTSWIMLGAGLATFAVSTGFAVDSRFTRGMLLDDPEAPSADSHRDRSERHGYVALALVGTAIVELAVAMALAMAGL